MANFAQKSRLFNFWRRQDKSLRTVLGPAERRFFTTASVLFGLMLFFGGGGAPNPLPVLFLELLGFLALLSLAYLHFFIRAINIRFWPSGLLIGGGMLVALMQMVPLPFDVWASLPGRELAAAGIREAGLAAAWQPLSLAIDDGWAAIFTILPALAVFLAVSAMSFAQRMTMARIALGVIVASALIGLLQFLMPETRWLYLSSRSIFNLPSGIFANRNFQSDFLIIGIILCAGIAHISAKRDQIIAYRLRDISLMAFLAVMIIATKSRFGFLMVGALTIILIAETAWNYLRSRAKNAHKSRSAPRLHKLTLMGGSIFGAVTVAIIGFILVTPVLDRFTIAPTEDTVGELRITAIPDVLLAIKTYFPMGSGLGTFDPVYRSVESLHLVGPRYFNHAHNDYFELALEMGAAGIVLAALIILAVIVFAFRAIRKHPLMSAGERYLSMTSIAGMTVLLAHSWLDYPLRMIALQCLFAFFAAILFAVPAASKEDTESGRAEKPRTYKVAIIVVLALFGLAGMVPIAQAGLAKQALAAGAPSVAYTVNPGNHRANVKMAQVSLFSGDQKEAELLAQHALQLSPLDAGALRTLGEARNERQANSGDALIMLAGRTTWRDDRTQLWLVQRGLLAGNWRTATLRAEALARTDSQKTATFTFLRMLSALPQAREMIVESLSKRPIWRRDFLYNDEPRTPDQTTALADLLTELANTEAPPSLGEARSAIDALTRDGEMRRAFSIYSMIAPKPRAGNLLNDPGFSKKPESYPASDRNTVFDWRLHETGNALSEVERLDDERNNQAVFIRAEYGEGGRLVERSLVLEPGRYRLNYRVMGREGSGEGLIWAIRCDGGASLSQAPLASTLDENWTQNSLVFSVPTGGCAGQVLTLAALDVPAGERTSLFLDDVSLTQIGR